MKPNRRRAPIYGLLLAIGVLAAEGQGTGQYRVVPDAAQFVPDRLSVPIPVAPDTHTITSIADEATRKQIELVLAQPDQVGRQVLIKTVFLQVSLKNAPEFGISQLVGKDFPATLQAIARAGKAEILARPSVLARDGQMTEIVVGQSVYLPGGVVKSASDLGNTTLSTYENVGIQLDVTPYIGTDNQVKMNLILKDTAIDASSPGQVFSTGSFLSGNVYVYAPDISNASASSEVVTPDGETVVIGGLIQNSQPVNATKVPILGNIPLLGHLFKTLPKRPATQELVVFITPHIFPAPEELAALGADERVRSGRLSTNSLTELELNQFLQSLPVQKSRMKKSG
jgi:type II secretory pathway component GspD/PulD (secretin)